MEVNNAQNIFPGIWATITVTPNIYLRTILTKVTLLSQIKVRIVLDPILPTYFLPVILYYYFDVIPWRSTYIRFFGCKRKETISLFWLQNN